MRNNTPRIVRPHNSISPFWALFCPLKELVVTSVGGPVVGVGSVVAVAVGSVVAVAVGSSVAVAVEVGRAVAVAVAVGIAVAVAVAVGVGVGPPPVSQYQIVTSSIYHPIRLTTVVEKREY